MHALVAGPTTGLARFSEQGCEPQVLHRSERQTVVLAALEEGQHTVLHAPDVDLTVVATFGVGDIVTRSGARAVRAGDVVVIPAGATREMRARGGRLIAVLIASPPPAAAGREEGSSAAPWPAPSPPRCRAGAAIPDEHRHVHSRLDEFVRVADEVHVLTDGELRGRLATILTFLERDLLAHSDVAEEVPYPPTAKRRPAVGEATATMSANRDAIRRRVDELSAAGDRLGTDGRGDVRRLLLDLHGLLGCLTDLQRDHADAVGDGPPR